MLDHLYAATAAARRRWFERHPEQRRRLARPVVSVGNLSVGGTGKTPVVAALAAWLRDRGERPAILSRGYKRRDPVDGVTVVSDGARVLAPLAQAGDEPLMLARALAGVVVAVCEDRHLAGTVAERALGATVHILDDGFQHLTLARDLDILVTSPGEITEGRVLPRGRLREAASAAARAGLVVVFDATPDEARQEAWALGIGQVVRATRQAAAARRETGAAVAVAGLGRPAQFFRMLREAGYQIADTMAFADHHPYAAADVTRIAEAARAAGTTVVITTEKDAVRFEPLAPLPFTLVPVPLVLGFDGWDVMTATVTMALQRAREAA